MAELFALIYESEAARDLLPEELDSILLQARVFNTGDQVTGVLLYGDGRFFQLLEGPEASVRKVFDRISNAQAHKEIRVLSQGPVAQRLFESWHMAFTHSPISAMQDLSQFAWEDVIPYATSHSGRPSGLDLVMHYWEKWSADANGCAP